MNGSPLREAGRLKRSHLILAKLSMHKADSTKHAGKGRRTPDKHKRGNQADQAEGRETRAGRRTNAKRVRSNGSQETERTDSINKGYRERANRLRRCKYVDRNKSKKSEYPVRKGKKMTAVSRAVINSNKEGKTSGKLSSKTGRGTAEPSKNVKRDQIINFN